MSGLCRGPGGGCRALGYPSTAHRVRTSSRAYESTMVWRTAGDNAQDPPGRHMCARRISSWPAFSFTLRVQCCSCVVSRRPKKCTAFSCACLSSDLLLLQTVRCNQGNNKLIQVCCQRPVFFLLVSICVCRLLCGTCLLPSLPPWRLLILCRLLQVSSLQTSVCFALPPCYCTICQSKRHAHCRCCF